MISTYSITSNNQFQQYGIMRKSIYLFFILYISYSVLAASKLFLSPPVHFTDKSELSDGKLFKLEIKEDGVYKLSYEYIKNLGIDVDKLNPKNIKIFGNGGGRLKQLIDENYTDDLVENPIYVEGEEDGKFDNGDFILFYAEGPNKWQVNQESKLWEFDINIYSTSNFYVLKISDSEGKRIKNYTSSKKPTYHTDEIDSYAVYEKEENNLLGNNIRTEGSGQDWYGDFISNNTYEDFSDKFNDFKFIKEKGVNLKVRFAGRDKSISRLYLKSEDYEFVKELDAARYSDVEAVYAHIANIDEIIYPKKDKLDLKLKYTGPTGWLDKITVNGKKKADFGSDFLIISNKDVPENSIVSLKIHNIDKTFRIWDITNLGKIKNFTISEDNGLNSITYNSKKAFRFVCFSNSIEFKTPAGYEKIENQNLHGIRDAEMLVVYHSEFEEAAKTFTEHRQNYSDIKVYPIEISKIYNEFSTGKKDPTAIRDFARMLYETNPKFKYVLLIGDGSYDFRGINTEKDDFIPVYESKSSLDPVDSYPSDDYFGLLTLGEGEGDSLMGKLDVGIGRFPVRTAKQANIFVKKLIDYETNPDYLGDWQNNITLCADDEDGNNHFRGAEKIYHNIKNKYRTLNFNKIYLDAFEQENNAGGDRYPDVNTAINSGFYKGQLIFNYVGHGSPKGLAQERILLKDDINSWNNVTKLPLLITATCSFMGFDDPAINTAGEEAFLKEKGGVIGLFSTVRAVYSASNDLLMKWVYNTIFDSSESKFLPLGDIIRIAKNKMSNSKNKRKFLLFGDPSLRLKFPSYKIYTEKINNIATKIDSSNVDTINTIVDTINALEKVEISGYIGDNQNNIINDFNGNMYVTIFDKADTLKTLGNDPKSHVAKFISQNSILFKGSTRVTNGKFTISFIIPKDINYNYGRGKISYYAVDENQRLAGGRFDGIVIGGTAPKAIADNKSPIIKLFMNDTLFINGGITSYNPVLLGFIEDESGINVSNFNIGHNLNAILDEKNENKFILNNFYHTEVDDYTKGTFRYPLYDLKPGKHSITVEAWDILNNREEAKIEFIVVEKNRTDLVNVFNYPNPFSDNTTFSFEYDLEDIDIDINIEIYSLNGKLVKTINRNEYSTGFRSNNITWDGTNNIGSKVSTGIYLYKIKVFDKEHNIRKESKFEKLVIYN